MTPRFFIDRPVFSWVIALSIVLAGALALRALPIEQYPSIAPPSLTVGVVYPGADASVLATNVTQVMEQELNGVEGFLYMSSTSRSNGSANITVTFETGTNIDVALMEKDVFDDDRLGSGTATIDDLGKGVINFDWTESGCHYQLLYEVTAG